MNENGAEQRQTGVVGAETPSKSSENKVDISANQTNRPETIQLATKLGLAVKLAGARGRAFEEGDNSQPWLRDAMNRLSKPMGRLQLNQFQLDGLGDRKCGHAETKVAAWASRVMETSDSVVTEWLGQRGASGRLTMDSQLCK